MINKMYFAKEEMNLRNSRAKKKKKRDWEKFKDSEIMGQKGIFLPL